MRKFTAVFLSVLLLFSPISWAVSTATCNDTSDLVLYLDGEGTDGSTSILDTSPTTKTVTPQGNAQIDTAQFKFGAASILTDGTGDGLKVTSHADFALPGDFTLDYWTRYNSFTQNYQFQWGTATSTYFNWHNTGGGRFDCSVGGAGCVGTSFSTSNSVWYHVAYTKTGTTCRNFADGVMVEKWTCSGAVTQDDIWINIEASGVLSKNGWTDNFRLIKGTCVSGWCSDSSFTPPSATYTSCTTASSKLALLGVG